MLGWHDPRDEPRVPSARVSSLVLLSAGLAACTLIGGVDEFTDARGGGGSEAGAGGAGAGDLGQCEECDDGNPCTQESCVGGVCARSSIEGPCAEGVCEDGTCEALGEDCSNGTDDNGDGLADCADPVCGGLGYRCVPAPPSGWTGPVGLASDGDRVSCAGAYEALVEAGPSGLRAEPATCSSCACTPGEGQCPAAIVTVVRDFSGGCSGLCSGPLRLEDGECKRLTDADASCWDGGGDDDFGNASVASVQVGSWTGECTPAGGDAVVAPPSWDAIVTVCGGPAGGGCEEGAVCAAPTPPSFEAAACISREGDLECPARYPARTVVHEGVEDNRGCTPCACSAGSCTGALRVYDDSCGDGNLESEVAAPFSSTCVQPESDDARARYVVDRTAVCQPTVPEPTGSARPIQPTTVCCRAE